MSYAVKKEAYHLRPLCLGDVIEDITMVADELDGRPVNQTALRDAAELLRVYSVIFKINVLISAGIILGLLYLGFRSITGM